MAINNITWKNVAAPDDAALLKLHGDSYANIGDSIGNIGSAIEGYTDKRQTGINDQISSDIGAQIAGAQNQDQLSQAILSFRNSGYEGNPDILNAAIGTKANQIQRQGNADRTFNENIRATEVAEKHAKDTLAINQAGLNRITKQEEATKVATSAIANSLNPDGTIDMAKLAINSQGMLPADVNAAVNAYRGAGTGITANITLEKEEREKLIADNDKARDYLRSLITDPVQLSILNSRLAAIPRDAKAGTIQAIVGGFEERTNIFGVGNGEIALKTGKAYDEGVGGIGAEAQDNVAELTDGDSTEGSVLGNITNAVKQVFSGGDGKPTTTNSIEEVAKKLTDTDKIPLTPSKVPLISEAEYLALSTKEKEDYTKKLMRETNRKKNAKIEQDIKRFLKATGQPRTYNNR